MIKSYNAPFTSGITIPDCSQSEGSILFSDASSGHWLNLYLVLVGSSYPGSPILACNQGLWVKKDINASGAFMTNSPGGGTGGGAVLIGKGFYGNSSFPPCIVLTEQNTLYLYTNVVSQTLGNMQLGNLTAAGTITIGSNLTVANSITIASTVGMSTNNERLKLSLPHAFTLEIGPFSYGMGFITNCYYVYFNKPTAFDGNVVPWATNTYSCGTSTGYWQGIYTGTLYYKSAQMFGCAKGLSDQVVEPRFKSTDEAEAFLRHETTKAWRHIKYADSGKMVCTCGKEVDAPCPEHEAEWQEKYCHNTGDMIEASGQLVVKILDEIKELRTIVNKLQTKLGDAA